MLPRLSWERKLAFTAANERLVRTTLFKHWEVYYARRRYLHLTEMSQLSPGSTRYQRLADTRYIEEPSPTDLSGACKIASQVALLVFALDGSIRANPSHTFVLLRGGDVYDFNRACMDVNTMLADGEEPYVGTARYTDSGQAVAGRESWHPLIDRYLDDLSHVLRGKQVDYHTGRQVSVLPRWCQPNRTPQRIRKVWRLTTTRI